MTGLRQIAMFVAALIIADTLNGMSRSEDDRICLTGGVLSLAAVALGIWWALNP